MHHLNYFFGTILPVQIVAKMKFYDNLLTLKEWRIYWSSIKTSDLSAHMKHGLKLANGSDSLQS